MSPSCKPNVPYIQTTQALGTLRIPKIRMGLPQVLSDFILSAPSSPLSSSASRYKAQKVDRVDAVNSRFMVEPFVIAFEISVTSGVRTGDTIF